jgi:hypothetical protein
MDWNSNYSVTRRAFNKFAEKAWFLLGPVNTMSFRMKMRSSDLPMGYSAPREAFWCARMPANWAAADLSRRSGDPPYYLRHTYKYEHASKGRDVKHLG